MNKIYYQDPYQHWTIVRDMSLEQPANQQDLMKAESCVLRWAETSSCTILDRKEANIISIKNFNYFSIC